MTDQLRALAEAEANKLYPPNRTVDDPFGETGVAETDPYGYDEYANNAYVRGFIAGRTSVTREQIEDAINTLSWGYIVDGPSVAEIARTVHELLNGENDD